MKPRNGIAANCKFLISLVLFFLANNLFAASLPLSFRSQPQYPITVTSGQATVSYILQNNTSTTLPLSISLTPNNLLQVGNANNTCGRQIAPHSICQLPVVFTAPITLTKTKILREIIGGSLVIDYRGRFPLRDDSIRFDVVPSIGALTITYDPTFINLQYQSFIVQNLSAFPASISSILFNGGLAGKVAFCAAGSTSCAFQSTCVINQPIPPGGSCRLFFQGINSPDIALGNQSGSIAITTNNGSSQVFNANYSLDMYASGGFTTPTPRLTRYDVASNTWVAFGASNQSAFNADIFSIYQFNGDFIVGGSFSLPTTAIAKYDLATNTWISFGATNDASFAGGSVRSSTEFNNSFIVGGVFLSPSLYISKYDASANLWTAFGATNDAAFSSPVNVVANVNGTLLAGGSFFTPGNRIVQYDPITNSWVQFPAANQGVFLGSVLALGYYNGFTLAGGTFLSPANQLAKYDVGGGNWGAFGATNDAAFNNPVDDFLVVDGILYTSGQFTAPGNFITKYDVASNTWVAFGATNDAAFDASVFGLGRIATLDINP